MNGFVGDGQADSSCMLTFANIAEYGCCSKVLFVLPVEGLRSAKTNRLQAKSMYLIQCQRAKPGLSGPSSILIFRQRNLKFGRKVC